MVVCIDFVLYNYKTKSSSSSWIYLCVKFAIKFEIYRLSFSGYRAILAEPKNKSSESSEQDYYSNMRQETLGHEPRVNMFSFGK